MSTEENEDMQMETEGSSNEHYEAIDSTRISPRVLIVSTEEFTFCPHPDGMIAKAVLDWAADKESELARKEKKARRKEKHKERKNGSLVVSEVADATDVLKTPKTPPGVKVSNSKNRKRKNEAVKRASKYKVSLEQAPPVETP